VPSFEPLPALRAGSRRFRSTSRRKFGREHDRSRAAEFPEATVERACIRFSAPVWDTCWRSRWSYGRRAFGTDNIPYSFRSTGWRHSGPSSSRAMSMMSQLRTENSRMSASSCVESLTSSRYRFQARHPEIGPAPYRRALRRA
jgi:hypothetical protein